MYLKRGLERESCDFCYARKVKCDRVVRLKGRHDKCSQCATRQIPCRLDSDDVRTRRQRQKTSDYRQGELGASPNNDSENHRRVSDAMPDAVPTSDILPHRSSAPRSIPTAPSTEITADFTHFANHQTDELQCLNSFFDLSDESALFLDNVFMGDHQLPGMDLQLPSQRASLRSDEACEDSPDQLVDVSKSQLVGDGQQPEVYATGDVDPTLFEAALHAYFDMAAHCLPILLEDAFWLDYHAGRCSPALVFAVASRGMPFTVAEDKWSLEQQCAHCFREAFLKTQLMSDSQRVIRLDELEALALMVNFKFDSVDDRSVGSHLEDLFLTHDSLVLMILQANHNHAEHELETLARAEERRTLLFWHTYGLDAFYCLNYKRLSRIQDSSSELVDPLPPNPTGGYLDTILALATIARQIQRTLCSPRSKQQGIAPGDVDAIYETIQQWRKYSCPPLLHWGTGNSSDITYTNGHHNSSQAELKTPAKLRQAVVGLLDLDCYMQMEDCIAQYGIRGVDTLEAEMCVLRVEYETLRAVNNFISASQSLPLDQVFRGKTTQRSLVDLSPSILRNICAGVCRWLCLRAQTMHCKITPDTSLSRKYREQRKNRDDVEISKTRQLSEYAKAATLTRDIVAGAISHRDTSRIVADLDIQIGMING